MRVTDEGVVYESWRKVEEKRTLRALAAEKDAQTLVFAAEGFLMAVRIREIDAG